VAAARAGTRLALVAAWQYLPARQRAFLILRDVLQWPAAEVAELLGTSTTAVNSGLLRARALVARTLPAEDDVAEPGGVRERALLDRFAAAFEDADVAAVAGLLRDDVVLEMPPVTAWFSGRAAVLTFVAEKILTTRGRFRLRPAPANGQPGFAVYLRAQDGTYRAHAVQVLTVTTGGIARLDIFLDPGLFRVFGLPAQLGEPAAAGAATAGPAAGLPG
jgi:RNA polymerase sigma-70 factor (ECF subfamily)